MSWFEHIFIHDNKYMPQVADTIGAFAFLLDWFLKGVTTNVGMVKKSGYKSLVIGVTSMLIPSQIGKLIYEAREKSSMLTMTQKEYALITFTMSMTPFTCLNMFLTDLKIVHTEFGQIAQSSGMVTDVLSFFLSAWAYVNRDDNNGMLLGAAFMLFFIVVYFVRQLMLWVIRHTPEGVPVKNIYLYISLSLAYVSYLFWDRFLYFGPLGSFALGVAIPNGPPIGSVFIQKFESFNEGILLPLFGSLSMIKLDWSILRKELGTGKHQDDVGHVYECFSFLLILYVAKFVTSFLAAIALKMPLRDSIILGIIMGTKGSFELAYAQLSFEKGVRIFLL